MKSNNPSVIIVSSYRWSSHVRSILTYLASFANEDLHIVISNCNANEDKVNYLNLLKDGNVNIKVINHSTRVHLHKDIPNLIIEANNYEYLAIASDDDYVSIDYIEQSIELLNSDNGTVCSYGNYIVSLSNKRVFIDSKNIQQDSAIERVALGFNPNEFNTCFFAVFRRSALLNWANFSVNHPIRAAFFDFLHYISLLTSGKLISHDKGYFLWTAENWDTPESNKCSRERHYINIDIPKDFSVFFDLHFAVECANFLLGKHSPLKSIEEKAQCAQIAWERCMERFRPMVQQNEVAFINALSSSPIAVESLKQLYHLPHCNHPQRIEWFANIIEVYSAEIATRYRQYFIEG